MNIDPADIRLSAKQQLAIAHYAELEGKAWEQLFEDRFPLLEEPTPEELENSLRTCDQSMQDAKAGRGVEAKAALTEIASRLGLKSEQ